MSSQGLEVIDHTVHLTHEWINELADRLDWSSKHDTLRLLRATLTVLRDHLGPEETAQFAAQLPLLLRGMFYEGWKPSHVPLRDRRLEHFVQAIEDRIGPTMEYRGEADISRVFDLLNTRISEGEIKDVRSGLAESLRAIWPALENVAR